MASYKTKEKKNQKTRKQREEKEEERKAMKSLKHWGGAWAEEKAKEKRGKEGVVGRSIARPKRMRHIAGDALLTC